MGQDQHRLDAAAAAPRLGRRYLLRRAGLAAFGFAALPLLAACRSAPPTAQPTPVAQSDEAPTAPVPTKAKSSTVCTEGTPVNRAANRPTTPALLSRV